MFSHKLCLCDPMDCSPTGPLFMGFPRQEYWNGWPFPSPGDLPDSGIELPHHRRILSPLSHYVHFLDIKAMQTVVQTQFYMHWKTKTMYVIHFIVFVLCSKSLQLCPTLCNPMDCSPPGRSVHGILQARILEWAAIPFSRGSSRPRDRTSMSSV